MISIKQVPAHLVLPIRHKVMYPDMDFESIKLAKDEEGMHLALFEQEHLISVISLFKEDDELQFRKFATVQDYQGKGYGSKLLHYVIEYAKQENISRIWCNARQSAAGFYKKFGFQETDKTFFKDGFDFIIMELRNEQAPHE